MSNSAASPIFEIFIKNKRIVINMADGKKKRAIRFEEKIKSFLERLEFDNVDGAKDSFQINGIQVDVVGGHEDTLLIIECTMKQELGRKSVRDKIKEIRGSC